MEHLKHFLDGLDNKYRRRSESDFIQYVLPYTESLDIIDLKSTSKIDARANKDKSVFYYIMDLKNVLGYKRVFIQITQPIYKKDRDLKGIIVNLFK